MQNFTQYCSIIALYVKFSWFVIMNSCTCYDDFMHELMMQTFKQA